MRTFVRRWRMVTTAVVSLACATDRTVGPDRITALFVTPGSLELGVGQHGQLVSIALDEHGVAYVGVPTVWSSESPAVASVSETGAVEGLAVGSTTITATAGGFTATATVTVAPPAVIALSRTTVTFSGVAGAASPGPDSVAVTNTGGMTLGGLAIDAIAYAGAATGWLTAALDAAVAPTTLRLTPSSAGLALGTHVATVTIAAPGATNSPQNVTVNLALGAGPAAEIAISAGDGQTAAVNTATAVTPAVIVRDAFGNPVAGTQVTFAVTAGGGSITGATPTTGPDGIALVGSWTLGTTAGPNQLTATAAGLAGSPLTFTATATAGAATQLTVNAGNDQTATVNTAVGTPPSVRVRDQFNNPVAGVPVTFTLTGGGGAISPASPATVPTDASGIASLASWTVGTTAGAGNNTLQAAATGLAGSPLTFTASATAGAATQVALNAGNGQTATVNSAVGTAPSVRVRDQFNNPVAGVPVTFTLTGGGGAISPASPATVQTDAGGIAALTSWTLGTAAGPGNNTLQAAATGLTGSPVGFTATAVAGPAAQISKAAGDNQSATAGATLPVDPAVLVGDQFGNPVAAVPVTFAVASGGGSITGQAAISGANGLATLGSWTLGNTPGANTLTATAAGLAGSPLTFTATGVSGSARNLALAAGNAQTDTVAATLPIAYAVLVTDSAGNPVQGVTVGWTITGGGGSIAPPSSITNASGIATASRTLSTAAGPHTATASVGGLTGSPVQFTATATAGAATQMAASGGDGQTATVNTSVATAPSVNVRDQFNNPVPGRSVTFTVTGGGGSISPASPATVQTNAGGVASLASWTLGTVAGTGNNTLQATSTGLTAVNFAATATPGPVSASQSTVARGTATIAACSTSCVAGTTASAITVTARDQFNNAISGAAVAIASTGTNNAFSPSATGTTNASGVYTANFSSTTAQAKTISATAAGVGITQTAAVTVNPAAVSLSNSLVSASDNSITACGTSCTTGGNTASLITLTVRDAFSNVISGQGVSVSCAVGTSCTFAPASGTTNASGQFTSTFNSTLAQAKTIQGTAPAVGNITQTAAVTVTAAAASQLVITTQPAGATSNVNFTTQPVVQLRDQFGNNVSQSAVSVSAAVFSGTGTLAGTTSVATNASGQAVYSTLQIEGLLTGYGNHQLRFTSGVLTAAASNTFNVLVSHAYNIQQGIYNVACTGCHSLTYANTVNQASSCASTPILIAPSNTSASHLYRKVANTMLCGGAMPSAGGNATYADIIGRWINQGAPNN